ncbi:MAG: YihY/virulence factor BrkB family protein [Acidobacteriota bacterium]|nr:YihY/virulence factor BrkB family protein [Acidobacteriota bacterium]
MPAFLKNLIGALRRLFPDCITLSQAIAFNMFLAFFPLLLLALGLLGGTSLFRDALREIPRGLDLILPPGSSDMLSDYFVRRTVHPDRWIWLGLVGTLIAGTQVIVGYMEGFRSIEGDLTRPSYWRRQIRALALVCLTIVPMLTVVVLTVFGKQTRAWLMQRTRSVLLAHELEIAFYAAVVFVLAMGVLVLLYRLGRPGFPGVRCLLPGTAVASVLWWAADIGFGFYVRKIPYDVVYRGVASAIGMMIWMFLTALIVLFGAAYNAEVREREIRRAGQTRRASLLSKEGVKATRVGQLW